MNKNIPSYFWNNEHISLRLLQQEDDKALYQGLLDPSLTLQTEHGIALPLTVKKAEELTEFAILATQDGDELWFALENQAGEMVGYASLDWFSDRDGYAQCNLVIFQEFRRQQYGAAAFSILMRYLFMERRIHKVTCCVTEGNTIGAAFLYAMGFSLECFRSEMFYTGGNYIGEYYFGMLESEYKEKQTAGYLFRETPMPEDYLTHIPSSTLGEKGALKYIKPDFYDRPYFWTWNGITLRAMEEEDYQKNKQMLYNSWHCRFYDNDVKLPNESQELSSHATDHLYFQSPDNRLEFAICDENANYVGNINLCGPDYKNGKFSLSIYTLPEFQGHGYGTKAIQLLLHYAFSELRLNKLIVCVNDGNEASATMMRKAGLRVEGVKRESAFYDGGYVNEIFLGISKQEFYSKL